jgi:hypothetical protein
MPRKRHLLANRAMRAVLLLSVAGLATACDSTDPSSSIAGTWVATSFIVTEVGEPTIDVLALGGGLSIAIAGNSTTTGTLTIPGELLGGGPDFTVSMAGTAVHNGNTVEFNQAADSFVRDVAWTLQGNTLHGTRTDAGVTVDVTLTRQ